LNFANQQNNCSTFSGTETIDCPQIGDDITTCQQTYGKTILLSVGGATYTEGGFSSSSAATSAAQELWAMFGPEQSGSSVNRPFGSAVIDGFDFDFETTVSNTVPFASELRSLMDADSSKTYYLTAAPQCPYPDVADNPMLSSSVKFDAVWVQFYNNYCGLQSYVAGDSTQNNFDFSTWDNWAKTGKPFTFVSISRKLWLTALLRLQCLPTRMSKSYWVSLQIQRRQAVDMSLCPRSNPSFSIANSLAVSVV